MTGIPSHLGNYHIDVSRLFQRVNKMVFLSVSHLEACFICWVWGTSLPVGRGKQTPAIQSWWISLDFLSRVKVCSLYLLFWDPHTLVRVS